LDIGAHIGTFALWILSVNKAASIFSIEPDMQTYVLLNQNISLNKQAMNWQAFNRAASDTLSFMQFEQSSMSNRVQDAGDIKVKGITSTQLFEDIGHPQNIDIMKIDIEGSEEAFICSNPEMLERVEHLVIELHPDLCDADRVRKTLEETFPNIKRINERTSSKPLLYCYR